MIINEKLTMYPLAEIAHLHIHGRTTDHVSPLTLFWTGSGIELNVAASELWVEVEVNYESYEPWISVVINSSQVSRQLLPQGRYWICMFRGMKANTTKNIRIIKDVQPMSEDPECVLHIHAIKCDGQFFPVEQRSLKIEFVGDSITSGEGIIGAKEEEDWIPMWFGAVNNYTALTANALQADYRVISQSGWGVFSSWDNNRRNNIPDYYDKVCGVLQGQANIAFGAKDDYNFQLWQPDIVVVNLGTNDGAAFYNREWKDEITGIVYKQRLLEDGSFHGEDLQAFEQAAEKFLMKLRSCNEHAYIVWAYGMLGNAMMPAIYRVVNSYIRKTGDRKVTIFQLPDTTEETIGARNHPGIVAHERTAKALAHFLKQLLGCV